MKILESFYLYNNNNSNNLTYSFGACNLTVTMLGNTICNDLQVLLVHRHFLPCCCTRQSRDSQS